MKPDDSASPSSQKIQWLFGDFCEGLADALGSMFGTPPPASFEPSTPPAESGFLWLQPLPPLDGAVLVAASANDATETGRQIMASLGVENASPEELASTFQEALGQALASVARSLTARLGREVATADGRQAAGEPRPEGWGGANWAAVHIGINQINLTLHVGLLPPLVDAILAALAPAETQSAPVQAENQPPEAMAAAFDSESRSLDLLLDVELPISVSFGKANVPLKDVLKLTNGSIIELSRAVVEPVDVVINNCVIARGEVVVVEGNFGVRIQRVVSRGERLQSLPC